MTVCRRISLEEAPTIMSNAPLGTTNCPFLHPNSEVALCSTESLPDGFLLISKEHDGILSILSKEQFLRYPVSAHKPEQPHRHFSYRYF